MLKIDKRYVVVADEDFIGMNDIDISIAEIIAEVLRASIIKYSQFVKKRVKGGLVVSIRIPSNTFYYKMDVDDSCKLIYWMDDSHWTNEENRKDIDAILQRSDLILYANKTNFLILWKKYESKSAWLPLYLTNDFLKYSFNYKAKNKCLLSGNCCKDWYPIRYKVSKGRKSLIDICKHPGYYKIDKSKGYVFGKYADLLHKYECCVTDSSRTYGTLLTNHLGEKKFDDLYMQNLLSTEDIEKSKKTGQVLRKYFEIPSVGSLLIADDATPDMRELGFIPYENFIPVDENDVLDTIATCLKYPRDYYKIRRNGMLFVRSNHTAINRINDLKYILRSYI